MRIAIALFATVLIPGIAFSTPRPDALTLLANVSQQYADANSYHLEAIEEQTSGSAFERNWRKMNLKAIVDSEYRYHFEVRSASGAAILVSNGEKVWRYHPDEHAYTVGSVSSSTADERMPNVDLEIDAAKSLVDDLAALRTRVKSAKISGEQDLNLNGKIVRCIAVHYSTADFRFTEAHINTEETVWIEELRNVVVRIKRERRYSFPDSPLQTAEMVLAFPVVELNVHPPEEVFAFSPPAAAKLVASFATAPAPVTDARTPDLLGKQSPELRLRAPDGHVLKLSTYWGKPIFIDFWAGWCAGCVEAMPKLKSLYSETAPQGLIWISIDSDDVAAEVDSFLAEQRIPWPNYHDTDGSLGKAFGREGLPLGVLINADGKIIFYKAGYDVHQLRAAIAKLIPQIGASRAAESVSQ